MRTTPRRLTANVAKPHFHPHIEGLPGLPAVEWEAAGFEAPTAIGTPPSLAEVQADTVVLCWAWAEWAAIQHVFCDSEKAMSWEEADQGEFADWVKDDADVPANRFGEPKWTYWGHYRLVEVGGRRVLLFKSNTHLDFPGEAGLEGLVDRLADVVKAKLILSTGTAGGANDEDHVGTVAIVKAGTLDTGPKPPPWPTYTSRWTAPKAILQQPGFTGLLAPIPIGPATVAEIVEQLEEFAKVEVTLGELDPLGLCRPDARPVVRDRSEAGTSLLTTPSFVVGTTDNAFSQYACVEMDDAVIARRCGEKEIEYAGVRNVSDPAQNSQLSADIQESWGSGVYDIFGLYTSLNGALAAWATVS